MSTMQPRQANRDASMTLILPSQATAVPLPAGQLSALQAAYATPPREYHDWRHVQAVLGHFEQVSAGPGWTQPAEAWLAVLYHDAIYEAGRKDNEQRSAALARQQIARWLPDVDVDASRVCALIKLTARHGQLSPADLDDDPCRVDARHFLDCDMAILGAPPDAFDAYDRAIAAEYRGHVPGWLFRRRRRAFLQSLLGRERIFLSDFFHSRLDAPARANLRRVLAAGC